MVALDPTKHIGIVIMGLLGKLLFATNVLIQYSNEKVSQMAMTVAVIDLIFVLLFGIFIFRYYTYKENDWILCPITKAMISNNTTPNKT